MSRAIMKHRSPPRTDLGTCPVSQLIRWDLPLGGSNRMHGTGTASDRPSFYSLKESSVGRVRSPASSERLMIVQTVSN
jgi:hypothetical protein